MLEEALKISNNIEGWLTEKESITLFYLAKNCKGNGAIIEIGSWKGKSTVCLASGSKDGHQQKIYAIDPHTGSAEHQRAGVKIWTFEEFKLNIKNAGLTNIVEPLIESSQTVAKNFEIPVELIFIDGDHDYKMVKIDFEIWFPKIIEGGIMAFHDTVGWDGPKKVVKDLMFKSRYFKNIHCVDSITFGTKVRGNSFIDRFFNKYELLCKNVIEFGNKMPLPNILVKIGKVIKKRRIATTLKTFHNIVK